VRSHIAALQDLQAGNVDVYRFQTAVETFVAPVLNRFHAQYPAVTFNVRMSSTDEAMEALISGTAEVGLVLNPPERDAITRLEVFRDRMVAAFSPKHPLAGRKTVTLAELGGFPFVLTEPAFGLRQQMERVFARHGFQPTAFCVTNSLALLKEVASIGTQCTLLPRFAVSQELASGSLKTALVREFASDPLIFSICTRTDRSLSPAAKVFMDTVIDYCRRYRRL
jgi:DNA-binding transcriptional LysR family regulator